MAKLLNGILGPLNGKVGGVVAATWKGINYVRGYVIPANPQTTDQTTNRTKFGLIVAKAKQILGSILQVYWDPLVSGMSGFNKFVSTNALLMDPDFDYTVMKVAEGNLEGQEIDAINYATGTGAIECDWSMNILGNGLSSDIMTCVIFDDDNDVAYVNAETRNDEQILLTIPTGLTVGNLKGYLFAARGEGAEMEVADSQFEQVVAA